MSYLKYDDNYWAIDIEGDDLYPGVTTVWCACLVNIHTGEERVFTDMAELKTFIEHEKHKNNAKFVAHNGIGYDFPVLRDLVGINFSRQDVLDTLVYSQLYNPSLKGGHGLGAWGERLRSPKGEFNDFSKLTDEMIEYCLQDTRLCRKIFLELVRRMNRLGFTEVGLEIEHYSWALVQKQKLAGFAFDYKKAHILYCTLRAKENEIKDKLHEYWPPQLQPVGEFKRPYKKDGTPSANFVNHSAKYPKIEVSKDKETYTAFDFVEFHIGSPNQRIEKLLEVGWVPREFTPTGNPKPTNKGKLTPSLQEFVESSGLEEPKLIAQWIETNSRANMINTWMEAYNDDTGCIHGSLWIANTLRYRHSNPNTANIPAVRLNDRDEPLLKEQGAYTYEARDLWGVRSADRRLVGVDAKGIQLRVLAHYLNNPKFTEAVLEGDPHSYNQEVGGFRTRPIAKTFIYAFLLGAGDAKVGEIIGGSTRDGREIKKRFVANFPGLADLLDDLERQVERTGRIRLCDGTPLAVEHPHTRLGYLLQGDESRIMKKAAILTAEQIHRRKLDVIKVGDIHDEWQSDVFKDHVEELTDDVYPESFGASGKFFDYRLPIQCDSKVGLTWAQTH